MLAIVTATARNPSKASLFNHASMAWNNLFFFNTLVRPLPLNNKMLPFTNLFSGSSPKTNE